ncbi:hypothetical protein ABTE05_20335, partial [Acinetobacter baumannii]
MSAEKDVLERFAKAQDQQLARFSSTIAEWAALLPPAEAANKQRLLEQAEAFVRLRNDLASAGRTQGNGAARTIGDND